MKKKIAFVVSYPGSAESFLKDHFLQLVKEYEVNLVANFPDENSKRQFQEIGVRCLHVPIVRPISIVLDLRALFALRRLFKEEGFESVHSVTPKAGLLTSVAGWMAGVPHRIHIFTGQVWATRSGMMRRVLKFMDSIIAHFDTNILVDGESQRQFLIKEGVVKEKNSRVLANGSICGVKLERFNISSETRKAERAKFGFKENDVVFIFMGRLNHDKGIGELYEAFNKLVVDCHNAKLVLYGRDEGGYDAKIGQYANIKTGCNYFFPGYTSAPFDSLQMGDVFVIPTWREGFGSSVIESQALGLPVITSDAYGVLDASVPNETGLRCKVNDPEGLYECMNKYYNNPDMRIKHGQAGRKRVETLFDSKIVTSAWIEYYRNLFESNN